MKGWQLFRQSVHAVVTHFDMVLRVSLVPYGLVAAIYALGVTYFGAHVGSLAMGYMPSAGDWILFLIVVVVCAGLMSWAAVAWHRFILLNEVRAGWIPAWSGARVAGYLWRLVLLMLVAIMITMVGGFGVGLLAAVGGPIVAMIAGLVLSVVTLVAMYRLGIILAAGAIGDQVVMTDAWAATAGQWGAMVLLAALTTVLNLAFSLPLELLGGIPAAIHAGYTLVTWWILSVINLSLITTMYGHYIEGRALD